jgi:transketolase
VSCRYQGSPVDGDVVTGRGGVGADALRAVADRVRERVLTAMVVRGGPSHLASALSAVEILVAAASVVPDEINDVVVLSKGHAALAWYGTLIELGRTPDVNLAERYGPAAGGFAVHPERNISPSTTFTTGSLGHGLAVGAGWCLGRRAQGQDGHAIVVLGDGETQEGSVAEAAAYVAGLPPMGLVAVVDANGYGQTSALGAPSDAAGIARQFEGAGWRSAILDGHDVVGLRDAFDEAMHAAAPTVVVARTIKGNGCAELENGLPRSHYTEINA